MTIIIGAGIAGLWLHNRINQLGRSSFLVDINPIGIGQTLSAQGIIHGGIKYSLTGAMSDSAKSIASMPQRWNDCLAGSGELNLTETTMLAEHQLMWSTGGLASKVTGFFSSQAVRSKMNSLPKDQYPPFFLNSHFNGPLYQLNEPVLDTHSLVKNLIEPFKERILQVPDFDFVFDNTNRVNGILLPDGSSIAADHVVLTAGEGNEHLMQKLGLTSPKMQRRPLKMVLLKSTDLPMIYAHCIGTGTKPLVTISSHQHSDGDTVWYLGGELAEKGVNKVDCQLIDDAKALLKKILPWFDIPQKPDVQWAVHSVNRAEPLQAGLLRPDTAFVESKDNIHIAWPTKLALAPVLADKVIKAINLDGSKHTTPIITPEIAAHYPATIAKPLWERLFP